MTLVLPYCNNQVKNLSFEPLDSKMPCVFEGEPLDFESALMGSEWPTLKDIAAEDDYGPSAANDDTTSAKATSESNEKSCCKRKSPSCNGSSNEDTEGGPTEPKRACVVDSDDSSVDCSFPEETADSPSPPSPTLQQGQAMQDESVGTADEDEELYLPRRRVLQMWNSRQKWKDERKKVLKMSVGKLTEIEDPELWLLRSVLINNTIKRLHQDIRNERQAKIKHRQQKIDFYNEKYEPAGLHHHHHRLQDRTFDESGHVVANCGPSEERLHADDLTKRMPAQQLPQAGAVVRPSAPSDTYDDTSCDEIFGISEDFLRVTIPDRRVSSPIPMNTVQESDVAAKGDEGCSKTNSVTAMEVDAVVASAATPLASPSTTTCCSSQDRRVDCVAFPSSSSEHHHHHSPVMSSQQRTTHHGGHHHHHHHTELNNSAAAPSQSSSATHQRHLSGGSQCATQYRTNENDGVVSAMGDSAFPPRVPILDSVVYHSLLASLESS